MQISKTFLVVCAVAGCTVSFCSASPDSLSQAQAREALRQKIAELNTQDSPTAARAPEATSRKKKAVPAPKPQPPTQKPSTPIVTPTPRPTTAVPAAVEKPAPAAATIKCSTQEETARQRKALRQKMAELTAQEEAVKPAPPRKDAAEEKPDYNQSTDVVKTEQAAAAAEAKARTEEQKRIAPEAKSAKTKARKSKAETTTEIKPATFAPDEAPPPAVPASKEVKLADLLQKYKADQMTPEEYHTQRAKILAEP